MQPQTEIFPKAVSSVAWGYAWGQAAQRVAGAAAAAVVVATEKRMKMPDWEAETERGIRHGCLGPGTRIG